MVSDCLLALEETTELVVEPANLTVSVRTPVVREYVFELSDWETQVEAVPIEIGYENECSGRSGP